MKLYLWRDVLCDYSCGMAFAIAESSALAREHLVKETEFYADDFAREPEVHELDEPFAAYSYGGG